MIASYLFKENANTDVLNIPFFIRSIFDLAVRSHKASQEYVLSCLKVGMLYILVH